VTMHVNELDVRQLLELLSRRSGLNILVSPRVSGTITANFEGTTVDEVLKAVIKLAGLVEKKEGTIHYLYTKGELDDDAEITKREKILTRVYKLNYVRSDEMLGMIRPFLSADVGLKRVSVTPSYRFGIGESATFVSGGAAGASAGGGGGGGTANTGGPTNQGASGGGATVGGYQPPTGGNSNSDSDLLIVQDYESNLKIIDQIVRRIDRRPFQVLIEAVIISVDLERARELGVNFGVVDNLGTALGTIGSGASLNNNVGFNPTQLLTTGGKIAGVTTDPTGFASAANGAKFGFVANNVTGFVQALETIGSTKILASPRILVLNKQRAEIQLGQRLGFQTFSQNFTSTIQQVQFLNTGTLLRIRPFISEDGMVRMEIHPERSSGTVTNNIPNQQTAELTTNVMVPDGATLVIGGLMEDEDDYSIQGLPGLARLPVLGYLFGFRQKNEGRRELVVLLTPHIWSGEQAMAHGPVPVMGSQTIDGVSSPDPATNKKPSPAQIPAGSPPSTSPPPEPSIPKAEPAVSLAGGAGALTSASVPTPTSASVPTPAAPAPAALGPNATQQPQPSQPPRRRFFSSFIDRMSGRSNSQSSPPAKPVAASSDPNALLPTKPVAASSDPNALLPTKPVAASSDPNPVGDSGSRPADQFVPTAEPETEPLPGMPPGSAAIRAARRDAMVDLASWDVASSNTSRDHRRMRTPAETRTDGPNPFPEDLRSRAVEVGPRRHRVERGETFASIAQLYYGSPQYGNALWWFNRGKIMWPEQLTVGDLLIIPAVDELKPVPARNEVPRSPRGSRRDAAPVVAPTTAPRVMAGSASRPASVVNAESSSASVPHPGEAQSPTTSSAGGWVPAYPPRAALPSGWIPVRPTRAARNSAEAATHVQGRSSGSMASDDKERTSDESRSTPGEFPSETAHEDREVATSVVPPSRSRDAAYSGRRSLPVHVVQPQETLRSIARDRLGNSRRAGEIAELNQDRLAESGVLAAGQILNLPSDAKPPRLSR
jgi:type IV pilus secretin PilQ/predicted competence protein